MVEIVVILDGNGCLSRMSLKGHAGFESVEGSRCIRLRRIFHRLMGCSIRNGSAKPACAAVTLLARSVARLTASRTGWTVDGAAPVPGNLSLVINRRPEDTDEWLRGVTDTLIQALADIDEEYPGTISVSLEEINNGS